MHNANLRDILCVLVAQAPEYLGEHLTDDLQGLVVVVHEGHLEVQPHELRQVPVGVGVLGAEHRADREHLKVVRVGWRNIFDNILKYTFDAPFIDITK